MKCEHVINQLQTVLPNYTDLFTNKIAIVSLTYSNGLVTCTTENEHNLVDNQQVTIIGAKNTIKILTLVRSGMIVRVVTETDHDLTFGQVDKSLGKKRADISGCDQTEFNNSFKLFEVINRRTFDVIVPDLGPITGNGSPILENGARQPGFNGRQIITITGIHTFTYPVNQVLSAKSKITTIGDALIKINPRISGSISVERATDAYTAQCNGELWAFVVLGDVIASKDRKVMSDLTATAKRNTGWNQRLSQPFTVYVFSPSSDEHAGRIVRDLMEDVFKWLARSLIGVAFDTGLASIDQYATTFLNHGFNSYTNAYYIHEFNFESAADITSDDIVDIQYNVAFRDIDISITPDFGSEEATAKINLDQEPL